MVSNVMEKVDEENSKQTYRQEKLRPKKLSFVKDDVTPACNESYGADCQQLDLTIEEAHRLVKLQIEHLDGDMAGQLDKPVMKNRTENE